jgi:ABC-type Fe3+/spermidine/putrescine transport system ATPase subunit
LPRDLRGIVSLKTTISFVLDVHLRNVSFVRDGFDLHGIDLSFDASTHTAIAGPPGCGASTLLALIAGTLRPQSGEIRIGARVVNDVKASARPLLFATADIDAPGRWSVRHLLIAALRRRSLDRVDRQQELNLALAKWRLEALADRRIDSLSSTEQALANLARVELLRPAILVADRLLERVNPSAAAEIADDVYRTLRVIGATVISTPSSAVELGATDRVVVLDRGRVVQSGVASHVHRAPESAAAAMATGEVNVLPVTVRGTTVGSAIGSWEREGLPFQGAGVALVRPGDFAVAAPGEESDLIFGVEEASFAGGVWRARGFLTGGLTLRVDLPAGETVHKGRLLALRYDSARIVILPAD